MVLFRDKKPSSELQFQNSWGGAAYIWGALFCKYLRQPEQPDSAWIFHTKAVWDLASRKDIPRAYRAVLISTFDFALVAKENFGQYTKDLKDFQRTLAYPGVCHLGNWAFALEHEIPADVSYIGFIGTSVSGGVWSSFDEASDTDIKYDLASGTQHFEVYEDLAKLAAEPARVSQDNTIGDRHDNASYRELVP